MNPIFSNSNLTIWVIPSGPYKTNCYVLSSSQQAIIIDPAPYSFPKIIQVLEKLTPQSIVLTHSHWDHIADCGKLLEQYPNLPVLVHELDRANLENPGADELPFWIPIPKIQPKRLLQENDTITLGEEKFFVIHTPGHSPGCICLYNEKNKILFSGDTLFQGTYGNISFPTSEPDKMEPSLQKLQKLPDDTIVFPGHGDPTTIGEEKGWLPS